MKKNWENKFKTILKKLAENSKMIFKKTQLPKVLKRVFLNHDRINFTILRCFNDLNSTKLVLEKNCFAEQVSPIILQSSTGNQTNRGLDFNSKTRLHL